MNGRWILHWKADTGDRDERVTAWMSGPGLHADDGPIPVVPCDTAAVERAAKAEAEHAYPEVGWHPDTNTFAVYFHAGVSGGLFKVIEGYMTIAAAAADIPRLRAVAALRAAGAEP